MAAKKTASSKKKETADAGEHPDKAKAAKKAKKSRKSPSPRAKKKHVEAEKPAPAPFVSPPKPKPSVSPPKAPAAKAIPPVVEKEKRVKEEKKQSANKPPKSPATLPPLPDPSWLAAEPKKKEAPKAVAKSRPEAVQTKPAAPQHKPAPRPSERKSIVFNEMMTVKDVADAMGIKVADVIKKLISLGNLATINQRLEKESAQLVAEAFGFNLEFKSIYVDEVVEEKEKEENLKPRSPVVTVMGHVDHGKTSLLDAIRSSRVAEREAGGITQHIGAYQVKTQKGTITFLDTPGHEAFTAMRARGAVVTDLVVLVVAADDAVMPQTVEAIDHAKAAGVPIVVAINKVDLPAANVQRVKQELSKYELIAEDWGGKTQMVEVSAKTKHNIDNLLEMILLESEILELKANPDRPAKGFVLEAKLDPRRGSTTTVLIQAGTLRVGDVVVCGLSSGRIRAMFDESGGSISEAGPSVPVEVLGLAKVPHVGDQLSVVRNDQEAREIAERRAQNLKESTAKKSGHVNLESLHAQIQAGAVQQLNIILKADVQGSLQAIQDALAKLSTNSIQVRFIHVGVGNVNDSDVLLAETSNSIVFGFNVKVEGSAESEAKKGGVDIRLYGVIYEMVADVRAAMEGLLKPIEVEVVKGRALVKAVFPSSRHGQVAGCLVQEGKVTRGWKARLLRNGEVIGRGFISTLRRFKDDVKDVDKGYECGINIDGIKSYKPDDIIEVFVIEKQARRLDK